MREEREAKELSRATEEQIAQLVKLFNFGVIDVPDTLNARGFTTHYLPQRAMREALAQVFSNEELEE